MKKIQELGERRIHSLVVERQETHNLAFTHYLLAEGVLKSTDTFLLGDLSEVSRPELLKVLTPQQREALERLSGMPLEKKK